MRSSKMIERLGRRNLDKKTLAKIKKLDEKEDKIEAIHYALTSKLELEYHKLVEKTEKNEKAFISNLKLGRVPSKIQMFKITGHKDDFTKVLDILNEAKKEVKNV